MIAAYWFALRVGVWLCCLPVLLRCHTLPALLQRLSGASARTFGRPHLSVEHAVRIIVRLCHLRFFSLPIFPRLCLRQSLALYRELHQRGQPAALHVGVQKDGNKFVAHSWVTLRGVPVAEPGSLAMFTRVYSYPGKSAIDPVSWSMTRLGTDNRVEIRTERRPA